MARDCRLRRPTPRLDYVESNAGRNGKFSIHNAGGTGPGYGRVIIRIAHSVVRKVRLPIGGRPVFTPVEQALLRMSQRTKDQPQPRRRRKSLIYIVDDETLLLDLAEASLLPQKYRIKKFQDPELALESFLKAKSKPDLLISDYAMGKMNGLELMEKCKHVHPQLKTLLLSGTAGAEIVLSAPIRVDRFLGKPYQPAGLLELVQRILE